MNRIHGATPNRQTRIRNTVYVGNTLNGKADGHGVLCHPDGSGYCGEWVNNKRQGYGIETEKMGTKYVYNGQWVNNKKQGNGSCIYNNGNSYTGRWREDNPHGNGIFQWKTGGASQRGMD